MASVSDTRPTMKRKLFGVLVTYRRPAELALTLSRFAEQSRPFDHLVVVDNAPSPETEGIVSGAREAMDGRIEYMPLPENLGCTGGVAAGMQRLLERADDEDWIVVCDDDDPPTFATAFEELERFAAEMVARDPRTGGAGFGGGRFDLRRGRVTRVPTDELDGPVPLDYLANNLLGSYRVSAVRQVGPWSPAIFIGFSEAEFGLRLRRAGFTVYGHGAVWRERRFAVGRADFQAQPAFRLGQPAWRRYYSLRNVIYILRQHGRTLPALRVSLVHGLVKPLANLPLAPRHSFGHLRLNVKAIRDGWTGRMGRRVEPFPWGDRRPEKVASARDASRA